MPLGDRVDVTKQRILSQRPDLNLAGWELMARIGRLWFLGTEAAADALKPFGLNQHEYVVLASLRDLGPPYANSPSRLLETALVTTSGGLTNMLNRLEAAGLVRRSPDPNDRRGVRVSLTDRGLALVQDAATAYIAAVNRLVSALSQDDLRALTEGLRNLLIRLEPVMLPDGGAV